VLGLLVEPVKTEIFTKEFDLYDFIDRILFAKKLKEGDVMVIASKIVSIAQGRMKPISEIHPTEMAYALANEYQIESHMAQAVLEEADIVMGGVPKVITSLKNGILVAFGGVDRSNVPEGYLVSWPSDPAGTAQSIHDHIHKTKGVHIGVIISDSQVVPLRAGTYGVAIGIAGFLGMIDQIGYEDLFGKKMMVTRWNIADNLASAANLVMGETTENSPLAIISEAPIKLSDRSAQHLTAMLTMEPSECMIFGCLKTWGSDFDTPSIEINQAS
jgi:coenzyme F420-0:L-glutamate ligase / coenzyme F420-1:gamma-L-glutamate ligase